MRVFRNLLMNPVVSLIYRYIRHIPQFCDYGAYTGPFGEFIYLTVRLQTSQDLPGGVASAVGVGELWTDLLAITASTRKTRKFINE